MQKYMIGLFLILFSVTGYTAENPLTNMGTFGVWTAYVYQGADGKVCYMAAEPEKSVGKYKKRDDVFLTITHRPADNSFDVVSVLAGYTYKKGSVPTLAIDKKKAIPLVSRDDGAWAKDSKTDQQLVAQMKSGSTAVLRGSSKRGTAITDTFSLKGFSKAYREISEACHQ